MSAQDSSFVTPAQSAALRLSATRRMMQRAVCNASPVQEHRRYAGHGGAADTSTREVPAGWNQLADMAIWQPLLEPAVSVIRRHPLGSLGAAAGFGAALIMTKPWRWTFLQKHLDDLPDQIGSWASVQLADPELRGSLLAWLGIQDHGVDAANEGETGAGRDGTADFSTQYHAQKGM
ncbi:hypothetical protein [Hydrogenophaga sp. 5NK40-0174]|uniref:hypothetical protein n=1 Tax=Hydrogenophaga sp. 5NK40-0174 TaxID=3127649 RepID=UPI00310367B7